MGKRHQEAERPRGDRSCLQNAQLGGVYTVWVRAQVSHPGLGNALAMMDGQGARMHP